MKYFLILLLMQIGFAKNLNSYTLEMSYSLEKNIHPDLPPNHWNNEEPPRFIPNPIWYKIVWTHPSINEEICVKTGHSAQTSFYRIENGVDNPPIKVAIKENSFTISTYQNFGNPICFNYLAGDTVTVYAYTSILGTYGFFSKEDNWAWNFHDAGWLWVYAMFTMSMVIINLILGRVFRSPLFVYYMNFILFFFLLGITYSNLIYLLGQDFGAYLAYIQEFAKAGTFVSIGLFTSKFFNLKRENIYFYALLMAVPIYPVLVFIYCLIEREPGNFSVDSGTFALYLLLNVAIGVYYVLKKKPWAKAFVFSWFILFVGISALAIEQFLNQSNVLLSNYFPSIGHMLEMCSFTLVLSLRAMKKLQMNSIEISKTLDLKEQLVKDCGNHLGEPLKQIDSLLKKELLWKDISEEEKVLFEYSLSRLQKNILNFHAYGQSNLNLEKMRINLGVLFCEIISRIQKVYPHVQIFFRIEKNFIIRSIQADLELMIQNLIDNSCKFSKRDSVIINVNWNSKNLKMEFVDDGDGFTPSDLVNLQEDFVQNDDSLTRNYEGLGLGLYLVKHSLKRLNGSYELQQGVDRFCVQINLPVDIVQEVALPDELIFQATDFIRAPDEKYERVETILIVDDNVMNRRMIAKIMKKLGFDIIEASDGNEALVEFSKNSRDIVIVLMDLQMPGMDGLEATRRLRLRDEGTEVPIIAITANGEEEWEKACYEVGMNGFLTKPFRKEDLMREFKRFDIF